jgi:RimJ/RimL family protein N-acetyltransferase
MGDAILYLLVRDGDELLGMFMLAPHNAICYEIHTCLLPNGWGPRARRAARRCIEWMWANTPCRRLITHVPQYNRLALRFALDAGMRIYGCNRQSWLKDGAIHDQICLGLSKED